MIDTKVLKANEDLLNKIHRRIADKLLEKLESDEVADSDIALAIKFLKDNNIKADPEFNPSVAKLQNQTVDVKKLPFKTED